ncbi:YiiX/YebB-like N1pC/P60 family cysteine hydrolase [Emticicia sp. SJ17W-69]|uniref:YiiX/YebB-like N1pC/P60 family cysteine hydrolase n=1 Tax=Emticicia sp. SJ17W-69 TaxID=3421657 RepID=UPI003EBE8A25
MAIRLANRKELDDLFPKKGIQEIRRNYEMLRNELQTGDLIFFSGNHWLSNLIRIRSKGAWSHVGIVVRIEEINRVFLVESILEVGVRMIPMSFVIKDYDGRNHPYNGRVSWARYRDLTFDKALIIKEFALDNLSKQYDRKEYSRILWRTITGKAKVFHDTKYTCSEYVYEAFKSAGIYLKYERGDFISPSAFWSNQEIEMKGIII